MIQYARKAATAVTGAMFATAGLANSASSPVDLTGTSAWGVQDVGSSCRLVRSFGDGDSQIATIIERTGPDVAFSLTLVGEPVGSKGKTSVPVTIKFGPGGEEEFRQAPAGSLGDRRIPYLVFENTTLFGPRPPTHSHSLTVDEAREKAVESLLVDLSGRAYRLNLGPMDEPMGSLRACTDKIVRAWGLDPNVQSTLSKPVSPMNDWRQWVRQGDFPGSILRGRGTVIIRYVLMVDATGAITQCQVPSLAAGDALAKLACDLLSRRVRLAPAIDGEGNPVSSFYNRSIVLQ